MFEGKRLVSMGIITIYLFRRKSIMKKKIMAVLLAATMAVGMLAGCGGVNGGSEYANSNLVEQNAEDKDLVVW